jgi:hypothetical protein
MMDEDWGGFVSAFTEAMRPEAARGPHGKRMLMVGFTAVLAVALSALAYGAFGSRPSTASSTATGITTMTPIVPAGPSTVVPTAASGGSAPAAGSSSSAGADWTAVAGPTCSAGSAQFAAVGYSTAALSAQLTGWSTSAAGGFSGEGCTGGFLSMPLSGQATAYHSTQFALWKFTLSARLASATCHLSTYVPANTSIVYVGGAPADYYYYGTDYSAGAKATPLGAYPVDQVSNRGGWVAGPAFAVTTGRVTVQLVDAGVDLTSSTMNAHAAVAQVRLTCRAA